MLIGILFCGSAATIRIQGFFLEALGAENKAILEHLLSGIGAPVLMMPVMYFIFRFFNWIGSKSERRKPNYFRKLRVWVYRNKVTKFGYFRLDPKVIVYSSSVVYIFGAMYWELYTQPLVEVHVGRNDPRGSVQLGQYMADLVGTYIFVWLTSFKALRHCSEVDKQRT